MPSTILVTVQPMWVHTALNALNWPAEGCVTTKSADGLMTPPPTGTSAVFTGVPLGTPAPDAPGPPEPLDSEADPDVVLGAAPVVGGVVEPPQAARAATPTTPVPPTPAARSIVRRSIPRWPSRCSPGA